MYSSSRWNPYRSDRAIRTAKTIPPTTTTYLLNGRESAVPPNVEASRPSAEALRATEASLVMASLLGRRVLAVARERGHDQVPHRRARLVAADHRRSWVALAVPGKPRDGFHAEAGGVATSGTGRSTPDSIRRWRQVGERVGMLVPHLLEEVLGAVEVGSGPQESFEHVELAGWLARFASAGTGDAQGDDDYRHKEYGDCRWRYRAGPVEAGGWGDRRNRDFQAHARQDFPGELTIVVVGGGMAEGVRDGERGEGGGGCCGCANDHAGGELAVGRPVRGGVSAGAIARQVGE